MDREPIIYIPTCGRAEAILRRLRSAPRQLSETGLRVILVVRPEECAAYAEVGEKFRVGLATLPPGFPRDIGKIRDHILRTAWTRGERIALLVDDDVHIRALAAHGKQINLSPLELRRAILRTASLIDEQTAFAGYPDVLWRNTRTPGRCIRNTPVIRVLFCNIQALIANGVTFGWPGLYMEDYHAQCVAVSKGLGILMDCTCVQGDCFGSASFGGCQTAGRDADKQARAAALLSQEFPQFVAVKPKAFNGQPSLDVTIRFPGRCVE